MGRTKENRRISWATPDDTMALVPLLMALYRHDTPQAETPTVNAVKDHIALLTDPATPHRLAVAWGDHNAAIGLAAVAVLVSVSDPRPSHWRQADLKELFVLPEFRGQRIGAGLLDWIEQEAVASGVHRLDWHVKSDNLRGIAFYQSHGGAVVENRLSMRKRLAGPKGP